MEDEPSPPTPIEDLEADLLAMDRRLRRLERAVKNQKATDPSMALLAAVAGRDRPTQERIGFKTRRFARQEEEAS